jgi:acetoin utilization protein AcuC
VRQISVGIGDHLASRFGFGPGDNPTYPDLYDAQALAAGSAMEAARLILEDDVAAAFAPAGGLHHAMPGRASGFCVFNDPAMAIEWLTLEGKRVAYVDIDCHHGDGVQHIFYGRDDVLTISTHESGQFLFPGTGFSTETGSGKGVGFSINAPLAPYTDDAVYAQVFDEVVVPAVKAFRPDVLVTQLGIDTHFLDPITHLRFSTQGFARTVAKLAALAANCDGWLALGGGGYDFGAVARGWSMAFAVMAGHSIPDRIPGEYSSIAGLETFADDIPEVEMDSVYREQISVFADRTIDELRTTVFPLMGID